MDGILLIDKPKGWSSFDVVAKVRSTLRSEVGGQKVEANEAYALKSQLSIIKSPLPKIKVGHTGTLDPLATGLMIVVVGSYCKRASEFSKLGKTYETTMTLGQTSTTGDAEGEKTAVSEIVPTEDEVRAVLDRFKGKIMQTPPIYSAIKVNGQRAYKLAREGRQVTIEPRQVTVNRIELDSYIYPEARLTVSVSSGTYIRSLVEDIGNSLGTGAYMSALRRTSVGSFSINAAKPIDSFTPADLQEV